MTNTRSFLEQIEPGYGMITQTAEERAAARAKQAAEETAPEPTREQLKAKPPEGMKLNPIYLEKRTKRMQLVLQPSVYEKVRKAAQKSGVSVNEYIHRMLEEIPD